MEFNNVKELITQFEIKERNSIAEKIWKGLGEPTKDQIWGDVREQYKSIDLGRSGRDGFTLGDIIMEYAEFKRITKKVPNWRL